VFLESKGGGMSKYWKRLLWGCFVLIVLAFHLLIGALLGIATAFYWLLENKLSAKQSRQRLSDTREIQLAFQQEMMKLMREAAGNDVNIPIPRTPSGIIDGNGFLKSVDQMSNKTLPDLGFKPEHIRVLRTLTYLLAQCSRLEATKQNLAIFEPLFHPVHPITSVVADAAEEVVKAVTDSIEPTYAQVR
jgi:hypothetical protein